MAHLDEMLAREGEMIITRHGKPIARITPMAGVRAVPSHKALRDSIPRDKKTAAEYIREDRDGEARK